MDEIQDRADAISHANGAEASDQVNVRRIGYCQPPSSPATQFKPGISGNPAGGPKGRSLTSILREILDGDEIAGKKLPAGKQVKDLVAEALLKGALKGGSRQLVEVFNRYDGKVTENIQHSGPAGGPIAFNATVCGMSDEQVEAWRQKKRAEIAARPTGPPP